MSMSKKKDSRVSATGDDLAPAGRTDLRNDASVCEKIKGALIAGNTYAAACRVARINQSTFYRWMKQGNSAPEGTLARDFFEMVEDATTQAEHRNIMCIQKAAGKGNWQAAAWWLERRRPNDYGRRDTVQVGSDGTPLLVAGVSEATLTDVEKMQALKAIIDRNPSLLPDKDINDKTKVIDVSDEQ